MVNTFNTAWKYFTLTINCTSNVSNIHYTNNNIEMHALQELSEEVVKNIKNVFPGAVCTNAIEYQTQKIANSSESLFLKIYRFNGNISTLFQPAKKTQNIFTIKDIVLVTGGASTLASAAEAIDNFRKGEYIHSLLWATASVITGIVTHTVLKNIAV